MPERSDTERLDWLIQNLPGLRVVIRSTRRPWYKNAGAKAGGIGPEIRAAIDAAMDAEATG